MTGETVLEEARERPTVVEAMSAVMETVRAVGKDQRNPQQGFNFRGIDAVVNAVSPALRKHGVVVTPHLDEIDRREGKTAKGGTLNYVAVVVTYTFTGPGGDKLTATVPGEAFDSGDKATAKAMSVAFRTALLQALALPTTDSDPDADAYEASVPPRQAQSGAGGQPRTQNEEFQAAVNAAWGDPNRLVPLLTWARQTNDHDSANRIQARMTALTSGGA